MSLKILTVDDSKAVRIIVKRSFKEFDTEIVEAANGVEGLAAASKEKPDLILLDVTMPVMDGVEMLAKLKSDHALKAIPVIMLTAEAGRQAVMKIAKLGIRDYMVKPFKEDVLVEKVGRVVDLRPNTEAPVSKKLSDQVDIVVVEDKAAIVEQIQSGLNDMPWKVHGMSSPGETIDFCQKTVPDVIIISLSLEDNVAFSLYRILKSDSKTKYVPVFGLAVKTDLEAQQKAQQMGFTSTITKPIDFNDIITKVTKSINLDTSERYFLFEEDYLNISLPKNPSGYMLAEVQQYMKEKVAEAVDKGFYKVIFDVSAITKIDMEIIKLMVFTKETTQELTLALTLVGNDEIISECESYEETKSWIFHKTLEEAKSAAPAAV